ncbi:MAG: lipocalin-like domain-containing protein, partial [Deltaproteobacteria bacterium]|nr:lipocalin-like domain-containing protein [Deltaproteobacteria bacterium]
MGDEAVWGTWRLLSFECERSDGRRVLPFGPDAFGQLIYGSDGRMSAILSRRDRVPLPSGDPATSSEAERAALADGFAAYGGTYIVGAGTVTHEVEASFLPNWVGA